MEHILLSIAYIVVSSIACYFILKIIIPTIPRWTFIAFLITGTIGDIVKRNINHTYSTSYSIIIFFLIVAMTAFFILRRRKIKV